MKKQTNTGKFRMPDAADDYRAAHPTVADRRYLNVVAQEFREVFPDYVKGSGEKPAGGGEEILQVDTHPLTIYSAAAVQELNRKVEDGCQRLEARSQTLEAQNAALKQELTELKALVQALAEKMDGGGQ